MGSRLLRNIAVKIGSGLAGRFARRVTPRPPSRPAANFYPFLDRLENVESRVTRVELSPSPITTPAPEEIEALGTLVSSQAEDIAALRDDLLRVERRNAEQVEAFGQKIALLEHQVPVHIEASIAARMTELEQRLRGEFQDIHYRTVDAFAETIEKRVVSRINIIENSLIEQSNSITMLREKSLNTDHNLQRLLEAVEKLCERAETKSQITLVLSDPPALPAPAAPVEQDILQPVPAPPVPEPPAPKPELTFTPMASNGYGGSAPRGSVKPVGMAILGLAILGLRLFK